MSLKQFSKDLHDIHLTPDKKHTSFKNFVTYLEGLKVTVMGAKSFSDRQLSDQIFKELMIPFQTITFESHLFAALNTLKRLDAKIDPTNFKHYEFFIQTFTFDIHWLVEYAEQHFRSNSIGSLMYSRPDQNAREIFDVSSMMLEIGMVRTETLYLREIFPVSIFLLRQTIEVYGKRLLGYSSITNHQGQRIRVPTQIAWSFIKAESLKPSNRIELPTDIEIILKVEQWTNNYVHTGNLPKIYLIENAVQMVSKLIYPLSKTLNYLGVPRIYGTSKIRNYNSIKTDFEIFVNKSNKLNWLQCIKNWLQRVKNWFLIKIRIRKNPPKKIVNWMPTDLVDVTIVNL
jgi:hypothetical protein